MFASLFADELCPMGRPDTAADSDREINQLMDSNKRLKTCRKDAHALDMLKAEYKENCSGWTRRCNLLHTKGRIKFIDKHGNVGKSQPMYGQVLFYFGANSAKFCQVFADMGTTQAFRGRSDHENER